MTCGTKMDRAAKFIDFFIHDILDYTILNKKDKNFEKNMDVFDIREAVQEILELLEDQIKMKQIKTNCTFIVNDSNFFVKSDKKRI
jgi:hypothetical protein